MPVTNFADGPPSLTAEALNAAFLACLGTSGGAVGSALGGASLSPTGGGQQYIANTQLASTLNANAATSTAGVALGAYMAASGDGATSNYQTGVFRLYSDATSTSATAGIENLYVYTERYLPASVPAGHQMLSMWGVWSEFQDFTNSASSKGGGYVNEFDTLCNNLDDANSRFGIAIYSAPCVAASAGGYPAQVFSGLHIDIDSASYSAFKDFITFSGFYTVAGIDMRATAALTSTVLTTLGSPSTTLHVSNVMLFSSAGVYAAAVSVSNPLPVYVGTNATPYSCTGITYDAPVGATQPTSGTLTFTSNVSTTDGTAGNAVTPLLFAIWMHEGQSLAFNIAGSCTIGSPDGSTLTIATGSTSNISVNTQSLYLNPSFTHARGNLYAGDASANYLVLSGNATGAYPTLHAAGSDTNVNLLLSCQGTGAVVVTPPAAFGSTVGFNGTSPIAKPSVTGSKGGNIALGTLITALASYGLVTDFTT